MSSQLHNQQVPSLYSLKHISPSEINCIAIVVAEWNSKITHALHDGAVTTLLGCGLAADQIETISVPGAFELSYTAARLEEAQKRYDAVILIGCVIRGETSHYDLICNSVTQGATELNLRARTPFIFGLVTVENMDQALARAGGSIGNKGSECAVAALQMIDVRMQIPV